MDVAEGNGRESLRSGLVETSAQFLHALVGKVIQCLPERVGEPKVEGTVGVTDHEAEVMALPLRHAEHLPFQRFVPFLLEVESGEVAKGFCHEVLVGEAGGKVKVEFKSAMHGVYPPWVRLPHDEV